MKAIDEKKGSFSDVSPLKPINVYIETLVIPQLYATRGAKPKSIDSARDHVFCEIVGSNVPKGYCLYDCKFGKNWRINHVEHCLKQVSP